MWTTSVEFIVKRPVIRLRIGRPLKTRYRLLAIDNVSSSKDRETEKEHLYIHTRIDWGLITVGDVVVFISDHETPLVATDNLNASLEIKREVEACSSGDRYLLVEVKKASTAGAKRLDSLVPAKIELQTNW